MYVEIIIMLSTGLAIVQEWSKYVYKYTYPTSIHIGKIEMRQQANTAMPLPMSRT